MDQTTTLKKIEADLNSVCNNKMQEILKNHKYISLQEFKSFVVKQYTKIAKDNKASLSEEEYNEFLKYSKEYEENICKTYQNYLNENKISSGGGVAKDKSRPYVQKGLIDTDPIVRNGHTFYNGRRNTPFSGYAGTNSTYSMADMVCTINIDTPYGPISTALGELQTITYSTYQRKSPVRTLGNMNPKTWVFGQRTIAGSLVFAVFNKHWMMNLYDNLKEKAGMKNWHFITDEIPPFDITITFANEYGFDSRMALYGVHIMTEGQTMSTNDIYIENTYEFVATDLELMDSLSAFQEGKARHIRGQSISSGATENKKDDNTEVDNGQKISPIDKTSNDKNTIKSEDDLTKELFIEDAKLEKMTEKEADSGLEKIYKEILESVSESEKQKEIKLEYEKQKKRVADFYKKKRTDKQ